MSVNRVKEKAVPEEPVITPVPKKKSSLRSSRSFIRFMKMFGNVDRNQVVHSMPFILFISTLLIIYIGNSYYAEGLIREIDRTKNDMKEKRAEYISTKSQLMYFSNQSELAKALEVYQIKESIRPPFKIVVQQIKN